MYRGKLFFHVSVVIVAAMLLALPAAARAEEQEARPAAARPEYTPRLLDADRLIGAKVTNPQGETLGNIEDVVLNAHRDQAAYAAVAFGGLVGIGQKFVAVPVQALTIECQKRDKIDKVILHASKAEFQASQGFDKKNWPERGESRWSKPASSVDPSVKERAERAAERTEQAAKEGAARVTGETRREAPDEPEMAARDMRYRKLTEIIGLGVKNLQGDALGDIEDVVLDLREGRPVYAVISFGGFIGLGEKRAAVPWSALDILPRLDTARIDVQKDVLAAIAYEQGSPPDLARMDQAEKLHERFQAEPYWQTFGYVEPSERAKDASPESWRAGSKYNANFDAKTIITKKGTVESVGTFRPAPNASPGTRLTLKTADGKTTIVYAGPRDHAVKKGLQFYYGDEIEVTGSMTKVDGRTVIMATEVRRGDKALELRSKEGEPKWDAKDVD